MKVNIGVVALAAIALLGTVGAVLTGHAIPGELWGLDGTLVGAAAGIAAPQLVSSPQTPQTAVSPPASSPTGSFPHTVP